MADFCRACSIELFGKDFGDFKREMADNEFAGNLCEHCGPGFFDCNGFCVPATPEDYDAEILDGEPNYLWSASAREWIKQ